MTAPARMHWCGTGAEALPGLLQCLSAFPERVEVWSDNPTLARPALPRTAPTPRAFDLTDLSAVLQPRDIIIAHVTGTRLTELAAMAANRGAHLVTPHPAPPQLLAQHAQAILTKTTLISGCGVSPGLDLLLIRHLVALYRASAAFDPTHRLSLASFAGCLPQHPQPFRATLGTEAHRLLRTLGEPAQSVSRFKESRVNLPWDAAYPVTLPTPEAEEFEAIPRGDATMLLEDAGFDPTWHIAELHQAILRPVGWAAAWGPVLSQIDTLAPPGDKAATDTALTATGGDRIVLSVTLVAESAERPVWRQTATVEAVDSDAGTAHARLCGQHVNAALGWLCGTEAPPPGHTLSAQDADLARRWVRQITAEARHVSIG
ncbi:hypothetical protein [Pseudaestuariivita sp.]|uniref:hypothetical protein n=1 Tax=Pseudaestuariivita sp. TaxID=2211669 RepID=UPI0040599F4E